MISFDTKLYILPKEKVIYNRGSGSLCPLRDVPAWCPPKTEPSVSSGSVAQARPCGSEGAVSQHPVKLASEGEREGRPIVANPTCPANLPGLRGEVRSLLRFIWDDFIPIRIPLFAVCRKA